MRGFAGFGVTFIEVDIILSRPHCIFGGCQDENVYRIVTHVCSAVAQLVLLFGEKQNKNDAVHLILLFNHGGWEM